MDKLKYVIIGCVVGLLVGGTYYFYRRAEIREKEVNEKPAELKAKVPLSENEEKRVETRDLAISYWEKGETEKAIVIFKEAIKKIESPVTELTILSEIYIEQKKYELAEETLKKVLEMEITPENLSFPYRVYGRLLLEQKKYEEALKYFKKTLEFAPTDDEKANGYFLLGMLDFAQGKKDSAIKNVKEAISLFPEKDYFKEFLKKLEKPVPENEEKRAETQELARSYWEKGETKKAIAILKKAIKKIENPWPELTLLSDFYIKQKKYKLAEERLKKALEMETKPEHLSFSYRVYGRLLLEQKKYEEALKYLNKALEFAPTIGEKADAYFLLGRLDFAQGKKDSAIKNVKESIRLSPEKAHFKKFLEDLEKK